MAISAGFVFTIFMMTLGPIKTVPAFFVMTRDMEAPARLRLAFEGTLAATAIALVIAFVMRETARNWGVTLDDLMLAGGILLFLGARESIVGFNRAPPPPAPSRYPAIAPLAIPTIVTPFGVVAILVFMGLAEGDPAATWTVLAILILMMALNFVGMVFARQIVGAVGVVTFQALGWIFAVLQAGLAIDVAVKAIRNMKLFTG